MKNSDKPNDANTWIHHEENGAIPILNNLAITKSNTHPHVILINTIAALRHCSKINFNHASRLDTLVVTFLPIKDIIKRIVLISKIHHIKNGLEDKVLNMLSTTIVI